MAWVGGVTYRRWVEWRCEVESQGEVEQGGLWLDSGRGGEEWGKRRVVEGEGGGGGGGD